MNLVKTKYAGICVTGYLKIYGNIRFLHFVTLFTEYTKSNKNNTIKNYSCTYIYFIWNKIKNYNQVVLTFLFPASGRCACGLGGNLSLGSTLLALPRPYRGTTLSLPIPALQTGHSCLFGLVSNHWWRHGQLKKWNLCLIFASKHDVVIWHLLNIFETCWCRKKFQGLFCKSILYATLNK